METTVNTPNNPLTPGTFRPRFGKFGQTLEDYTGAHVLTIDGKLATINKTYRSDHISATMATLYHFNGQYFCEHALASLRILDRTWNAA